MTLNVREANDGFIIFDEDAPKHSIERTQTESEARAWIRGVVWGQHQLVGARSAQVAHIEQVLREANEHVSSLLQELP